jgi:hypothetical protein
LPLPRYTGGTSPRALTPFTEAAVELIGDHRLTVLADFLVHRLGCVDALNAERHRRARVCAAGHGGGAGCDHAAERAGSACPVSRVLAGIDIAVNATLSQPD